MEGNRFDKYTGEPFDEDDEEFPFRITGMRKMSKIEKEKFPGIVADSIRCQLYHVSRFERCNGCNFAIEGCEKVIEESAS